MTADLSLTVQEALGPFLSDEAPLMAFRDSASYRYSYLCRVLYLLATGKGDQEKTYLKVILLLLRLHKIIVSV